MDDTIPVPAEILDEMAAYYRDRTPEYNAWFERRGNYDHGKAENARNGSPRSPPEPGSQVLTRRLHDGTLLSHRQELL